MLMSYDAGNEAKDILVKGRDNDAQKAQAAVEEEKNMRAKVHGGKADDVDPGNYSEYNIVPRRYREIYIHSKLLLVDDVFTTLGSANLNARSMAGDSELNICTEEWSFTKSARRRVFGNLAGEDFDGANGTSRDMQNTVRHWLNRMDRNKKNRLAGRPPENDSFIHPFDDPRGEPTVRLA
ncbi:hypothetical protein C9I28_22085 [Pseudoduganella armeniaca]|uniref:PLD phosphodiesterase domain-containing protein n=2 Tax=Pseudoduganella armeniaca TaxID=2072590 RepID=A0A2R4CIC2_9BURK|nr:hypothetical protein C9I28_22085 [Pseudoduganella armeniaca]